MSTAAPSSSAPPGVATPLTPSNRLGLALAALLGLLDLLPLPGGGPVGPPLGVIILDIVCGLVTLVCVVVAWRTGSRAAVRLAAGARILSAVTVLPAFFVGPSAPVLALAALLVILAVLSVGLMLAPARRPSSPVTD